MRRKLSPGRDEEYRHIQTQSTANTDTKKNQLDEFIANVVREKEALAELEEAENAKRRVTGVLDPITSKLTDYQDADDLIRKIDAIFTQLDADGAGGLDFQEFEQGIQRMPGSRIHMTKDDFEIITEYGNLLGANGQFNMKQFRVMMQNELFRYARRGLGNVLSESQNNEFKQSVLMLKMVETNLVSRILHRSNLATHNTEFGGGSSASLPMKVEGAGGGLQHATVEIMCAKLESDVKDMDIRIQRRFDDVMNDANLKHELMCEKNEAHFRTLFDLLSRSRGEGGGGKLNPFELPADL